MDVAENAIDALQRKLDRLIVAVDGVPDSDIKGMRERLRETEKTCIEIKETIGSERVVARIKAIEVEVVEIKKKVNELDDQRRTQAAWAKGIALGLGLTGATSVVNLALQVLQQTNGGIP